MADKQDSNELDNNTMDKDERNIRSFDSGGRFFEIRIKGYLDNTWSDWFEGMELKLMDNGDTVLFGHVVDQSELMGILNMLNRINLTLLSINEVKEE
ncbi:hypothetical protein ANRL1_00304 [Anaerolineae bacterium]|nr:hypothetical protein ANRL1_00304 [Anaerolineae bacterium]